MNKLHGTIDERHLRATGMELEVVAQVLSPPTPELCELVALAGGEFVRSNLARAEDPSAVGSPEADS